MDERRKIVYVCHDAHPFGAEILSLNIIRYLKEMFQYQIEFICLSGGSLLEVFKQLANVKIVDIDFNDNESLQNYILSLYNEGYQKAICNTVVTGELVELLKKQGFKVLSLIHELPGIITQYHCEIKAQKIAEYADKVVFASEFVAREFIKITSLNQDKIFIRPQGLYKKNKYGEKLESRTVLRRRYNLAEDSKIVIGLGSGDTRKGIDIFCNVASKVKKIIPQVTFIWIGKIEGIAFSKIPQNEKDNVIFVDFTLETDLFYAGADLYLLTSREDPFPSVVLEAFDAGLPVIGFNNAGGFCDIITPKSGSLVPFLDIDKMSSEVIRFLNLDDSVFKDFSTHNQNLIDTHFNFKDYIYDLLELSEEHFNKVSVIVPNYNYEKYLEGRINSILQQNYPVYELIFLDDFSIDNSVEIARNILKDSLNGTLDYMIVEDNKNSGSVFRQWIKGISLTKADYIWIAEADDLSEPGFLNTLMEIFEKDSRVVMAYSQSKQIDLNNDIIANDYIVYTNNIDKDKWKNDYIDEGYNEITKALAVKNTIPNVSAVVFKKAKIVDISDIISELETFTVAGDLFFYVWILRKGKIGYSSKAFNSHRRHQNSVTHSGDNLKHYHEIVRMQELIKNEFELTEDVIDKIDEYRKYVSEYLGVKEN